MAAEDPFDAHHLIGHVQDADYFEVPKVIGGEDGRLHIPQPFYTGRPLVMLPSVFEPFDLNITNLMIFEVVVAVIVTAIFVTLARRAAGGDRPRGRLWNFFEAMLLFIRDEVARPAIGKHDADKFMPLMWTMFFFVLGCNLLGLLPWAGSATGSFATTVTLALITFGMVVGAGMVKLGPGHFWTGLVPQMDLPPALMIFLWPMVFVIEVLGLFIKHFVLAVRLLANMMAGHLVLAVVVAFILAAAKMGMAGWAGVTLASVFGAVALNLLELFVAFLQAYIFTFLSALFIGAAVHPH